MNKKNIILAILLIFLTILGLGCGDQSSKDNNKYNLNLIISDIFLGDVGNYFAYTAQVSDLDNRFFEKYDDNLSVKLQDYDLPYNNQVISVKIIDYEIQQPTPSTIRATGHIKYDGPVNSLSPSLIMVIRNNKGQMIKQDKVKLNIKNHQTVPFSIEITL